MYQKIAHVSDVTFVIARTSVLLTRGVEVGPHLLTLVSQLEAFVDVHTMIPLLQAADNTANLTFIIPFAIFSFR